MGKMGVYRKILRTLKARTNQADKPSKVANPAEAIALLQEARDLVWEVYDDNKDWSDDIARPVHELDRLLEAEQNKKRAKLRLSQQDTSGRKAKKGVR